MPKIGQFRYRKGNGVGIIPMNYSSSTCKFSAKFAGDIIQADSQAQLEDLLEKKTAWVFDWKPFIEIECDFRQWFSNNTEKYFVFSYERFFVSTFFDGFRKCAWDMIEENRYMRSHVLENFPNVPWHKGTTHIVSYDEILWKNLETIRGLIKILSQKINGLFSDESQLKKMSQGLIGSLPVIAMESESETLK